MHRDSGSPTYRERIVAWRSRLRESARRARIADARGIAESAAHHFTFRRLYLFGSTPGVGAISVWSDLDLIVEGLPEEEFLKLLSYMSARTDITVDLKPMEQLPTRLQEDVRRNGMVVYER
jgi:predicted nucleotidyltransferase